MDILFLQAASSDREFGFKVLISEIPLIGFCVVIIIVLGMTFSTLFTRKIEQLTRNMEQVNQEAVKLQFTVIPEMKWDSW